MMYEVQFKIGTLDWEIYRQTVDVDHAKKLMDNLAQLISYRRPIYCKYKFNGDITKESYYTNIVSRGSDKFIVRVVGYRI